MSPCNSDYLEPHAEEREKQRAAKLLIYAHGKLGLPVPAWLEKEAKEIYARDERTIPLLCKLLKSLSKPTINRIVYNAKDKTSRDLADWWKPWSADREREAEERAQKKKAQLKKRAKAKLTKEELEALQ